MSFIGFFRGKQNPPLLPDENTGMERQVLGRMVGQDLEFQLKEFYSAYSKYIVIRADTWIIKYYSAGVIETLIPNSQASGPGVARLLVGHDIFHFLKSHQLGNNQPDTRTPVRKAIKSGYPISQGIRLQTRRSAVYRGDENFMTHWTPLKNEHGVVHWVVVTLGAMTG